jgi:UDP-N-acetylmuramyl tripeptide synthase
MSRLAPGVAAAKAVGALSRVAGRGGGTSLPGKVLTRLEPKAIGLLAGRLEHGSIVLSATNGKTTTAAMIAKVLEGRGARLVHNRAGANMAGGVASALAAAARGRGIEGDTGLFEVDEFWLPQLLPQLRPRAVLLANLFRDQLDRYGELETIGERWLEALGTLPASTQIVLNADDPLVADLGRDRAATYFGVDDPALARPKMQHAADSKHCRRCGHPYVYDAIYLGHLGHYHCANCGARRPDPAVRRSSSSRRRDRPGCSCRFRGSTTSTTRWRRRRCAWGWGLLWRRSWRGLAPSSPRSVGLRRSGCGAAMPLYCWSRTRPAPTRCCGR